MILDDRALLLIASWIADAAEGDCDREPDADGEDSHDAEPDADGEPTPPAGYLCRSGMWMGPAL